MSEQEYLQMQITMGVIFRQIKALPLDKVIPEVDRALTLGPLLDPTLYMKKADDAQRWLRIMKIYRTCRDSIAKEFKKKQE